MSLTHPLSTKDTAVITIRLVIIVMRAILHSFCVLFFRSINILIFTLIYILFLCYIIAIISLTDVTAIIATSIMSIDKLQGLFG